MSNQPISEQKIKRETVEAVWAVLSTFRKYSRYTVQADANALRAKLLEIGGKDCKLEI